MKEPKQSSTIESSEKLYAGEKETMKKYATITVWLAIVSIQYAQAEVPFIELKGYKGAVNRGNRCY